MHAMKTYPTPSYLVPYETSDTVKIWELGDVYLDPRSGNVKVIVSTRAGLSIHLEYFATDALFVDGEYIASKAIPLYVGSLGQKHTQEWFYLSHLNID